jgi:hypothetical protein
MQKKVAFQLGVIGVSLVALVLLSIPLFQRKKGTMRPPASHAVAGPDRNEGAGKRVVLSETIKLGQIKDDKFYDRLSGVAGALPIERDPFSFVFTGPKSSRDGLVLEGILWEDKKPTAIINQTFLNAGDSTGQFSVLKIQEDRVVLKDASGEFELRLKQ